MNDVISRQDAVEATRYLQTYKMFESDDMLLVDLADVQTTLMMLQSAQHRPFCYLDSPCPYQNEEIKVTQKKGHWIHDTIISPINNMEISLPAGVCSECDIHVEYTSKFCPNCGADMRGEADGENS